MADPDWKTYENNVANVFASAGLGVEQHRVIRIARGGQVNVDIAVDVNVMGIQALWLVECKLWQTPVGPDPIKSFLTTVHDVGADRGFICSQSGLTEGADMWLRERPITVTNLAKLRGNVAAALFDRTDAARIIAGLWPRLGAIAWYHKRHSALSGEQLSRMGAVFGAVEILRRAADQMRANRYPVEVPSDYCPEEGLKQIRRFEDISSELTPVLGDISDAIDDAEVAVARSIRYRVEALHNNLKSGAPKKHNDACDELLNDLNNHSSPRAGRIRTTRLDGTIVPVPELIRSWESRLTALEGHA